MDGLSTFRLTCVPAYLRSGLPTFRLTYVPAYLRSGLPTPQQPLNLPGLSLHHHSVHLLFKRNIYLSLLYVIYVSFLL